MRALSSVWYHSAILSSCPVRSTKCANLAGLIGCVTGASLRTGRRRSSGSSLFSITSRRNQALCGRADASARRNDDPRSACCRIRARPLVLLERVRRRLPASPGAACGRSTSRRAAPGGALEVIEQVVGLGDAAAAHADAVIGHEQHLLVGPEDAGEPLALGRVERRAGIGVVIGDLVEKADLGLADRQDFLLLEPRQRAG